jgi:hypothetical protein
MELSKEAIEEFKKIYYQEFGTAISDEKARELGENLLSLFEIIYRPLPGSDEAEPIVKNNKDSKPT